MGVRPLPLDNGVLTQPLPTEGADMEYFVGIDAASPFGQFLLAEKGKIGGASATVLPGVIEHPVIVCTDMDWSMLPAFVRVTHMRNSSAPDPAPRELVIPASIVLVVAPIQANAQVPSAAQQLPSSSLH